MNRLQTVIIVLATASWLLLWFMIARPKLWARLVDKENDFWVNKGIISATFSERCRSLEKGLCLKILIGSGAVLGTFGFLLIRFLIWKNAH